MNTFGELFAKISVSMALVIGLILTGLYYNSWYNDGSTLEAEIKAAEETIVAQTEKKKVTDQVLAEEAAIKSEVGVLSEKFKEITAYFPVNLKSDELVAVMNTLAKKTSVRVISVRRSQNTIKDLYEEIPLSLQLKGNFNNLIQFMYYIGLLEKVTNVLNFDLANDTGGYDGTIRLSLRIVGYKYRASTNAYLFNPQGSDFKYYGWILNPYYLAQDGGRG